MAEEIEFCVLGPLVVRCRGIQAPVPKGKQRAVLATLLLNANHVVSLDDLAESLWGTEPPPSARVTVQNYVLRLRKTLAADGPSRIRTQPPGYMIKVAVGELDLSRFEALLDAARAAALDGSWDAAARQARAALSLWRDDPLADTGSEFLIARETPRLTEMRLQALEVRIDADLHMGRVAAVIVELQRLVAAHPLREHLHAMLMLALYRDGRQAEALAAYQHAREVLAEELGTEPGTGLRELHQRVLTADPTLAVPGPAAPPGSDRRPVMSRAPGPAAPRQLPGAVAHFGGREAELAKLTKLLDDTGQQPPGTVVISAIGGMAGVGKTALAVRWAHQVADRFPDGQLYMNLRGYDPAEPMTASDALAGFLRALGLPGQSIPADQGERAALYRSVLAGKRMLVLLDNVASVEQARPLLPGTPTCVTVVTSRDALAGLVARDGATRLELDLLPPDDAVSLLRALIGTRVDTDPAAAMALASRCCRLPLALRVAAEMAAARPAVPLAELAGELADRQQRLDLLDIGGDPRSAVRSVFSWSYRHLDDAAARAFRLISLHPGADHDVYAAAALIDTTVPRAAGLLGVLVQANLVQLANPGRYAMHDLLRDYARQLCAAQRDEQHAALARLFDHYLYTAAVAADILYPAEHHRRPRIPVPATPTPPMTAPATALAWLDAELANLVSTARHADGHSRPGYAVGLAATVFRYLDTGGHYPEAIVIHTCARNAAHHTSDRVAETEEMIHLGAIALRLGQYRLAADHLQRALAMSLQTGDTGTQARTVSSLGSVALHEGSYDEAAGYFRQALAIERDNGNQAGAARVLGNLGIIDLQRGRYEQAAGTFGQVLALARETGDTISEAHTLAHLGDVLLRRDRYREAADHLRLALTLHRESGDRSGEAHVLTNLGDMCLRQGRFQEASHYERQALALCSEMGEPAGQADALNALGEIALATGQPDQAQTRYAAALGIATQIGRRYEQARAHNGLGHSHLATGDQRQACQHWRQALALFAELGAPEAGQIRALIAASADGRASGGDGPGA